MRITLLLLDGLEEVIVLTLLDAVQYKEIINIEDFAMSYLMYHGIVNLGGLV